MCIIKKLLFDVTIKIPQHGFTENQLVDLINFVHVNQPKYQQSYFGTDLPNYKHVTVIDIFHPSAPDCLELYLFKDDDNCWWPFATIDCLALSVHLTNYAQNCLTSTTEATYGD